MPKRRRLPTLKDICYHVVCREMDRFHRTDCNDFSYLPTLFLERIIQLLKEKKRLFPRYLKLLITKHLCKLNLANSNVEQSLEFTETIATVISQNKPNLMSLNVANILNIPNEFWESVLPLLSNLEFLCVQSTGCSDRDLRLIGQYCYNLKELDVSLCYQISDNGIKSLCHGSCGTLEILNLMYTQITEKGIRYLLQRWPRLKQLKWRNTVNILGKMYCGSAPPELSLTLLTADNSYVPTSLKRACLLCHHVTHVIMDSLSKVKEEELQYLENVRRLEYLHVVLNRTTSWDYLNFTNGLGKVIEKHGSSLTHLILGRFYSVDIRQIVQCCRLLEVLRLEKNRSYIWFHHPVTLTCSSIENLEIYIRDQPEGIIELERDIQPFLLEHLLSSLRLKQIKISASTTLDDDLLSRLTHEPRCKSVELLEIIACPNISIRSIETFLNENNVLRCLKLYRCFGIVYQDIKNIRQLIQDKDLDLHVDYITDQL